MSGSDLTFLVAVGAGLISFLSPCVLPLVPAYLGQLTAVAVAGSAPGLRPPRWLAIRHSIAYVLGFGAVFTLLGVTATYVAGPLFDYLPLLRQVGGVILVVLGLSLAGIVRIPLLERTWRPLEAGAAAEVASRTGTMALATAGLGASGGSGAGGSSSGEILGRRLVGAGGLASSFGLGAIFAIGWTPCIGVILGSILTLAASSSSKLQGGLLLAGYTVGLGIPFLAVGALYDRAPGLLRPLVRHGRLVSLVGGLLVAAIGVAMVLDLLSLLPIYFNFPFTRV
jgi:cytochrome c-type biogenesis protein